MCSIFVVFIVVVIVVVIAAVVLSGVVCSVFAGVVDCELPVVEVSVPDIADDD